MNISTKNHTPAFTAYYIGNSGNLKLYRLTDTDDIKFLKKLSEKTDMKKLIPNLTKDEYSRWHEMLEYAVDNSAKKGNITYLETSNNKPCGIITFTPGKTTILDCICTWPVEFGKKVKLAGKNLFYQMFLDFKKIKGTRIKLEAITNGPFDTVSKYESLGFKRTSNVFPTKIEMEANLAKIKENTQKLDTLLNYKSITPQKTNLNAEIDLS